MNEVRRIGDAASRRLGPGEAASRRLLKRNVLHFKQSGGTPLPLSPLPLSPLPLALLSLCVAATAVAAPYKFTVDCDEPARMRKVGETTEFRITCEDLAKTNGFGGPVEVWLDNFGTNVLVRRTVCPEKGNPIVLRGTLTEPGFLRAVAMNPGSKTTFFGLGKGNVCASVGYEPEKIVQGLPCPDDFDAYWQGERKRLAAEVPLAATRERVTDYRKKGFVCWKVSFATFGGKRVWGFLTMPTEECGKVEGWKGGKVEGWKGGKVEGWKGGRVERWKGGKVRRYPLRVNVPGAGPAAVAASAGARPGEVSLTLNVHPFEPAADAKGQKKLYEAQDVACRKRYGTTYATSGLGVSREEYFYHDIILGMDRAVDWAVALPEVDRSRVWYSGGSQGGGFGMFLMGLNRNFTRGYVWICAIADHGGYRLGRIPGWPRLVQCNERNRAVAERFAPYFDACNFAARVKIPIRMSAGLSDCCCPPPAVWSAYNALGSVDKAIVPCPNVGHAIPSEVSAGFERWLKGEAASRRLE